MEPLLELPPGKRPLRERTTGGGERLRPPELRTQEAKPGPVERKARVEPATHDHFVGNGPPRVPVQLERHAARAGTAKRRQGRHLISRNHRLRRDFG